jgi:hypothetical protein
MKLENTSQAPALEAAWAAVFNGIVDDAGLQQVMGWSTRTKERWISNGLPFLKIGRRRYFAFKKAWAELEPSCKRGRGKHGPRGH